jgi:hypothetical protein
MTMSIRHAVFQGQVQDVDHDAALTAVGRTLGMW